MPTCNAVGSHCTRTRVGSSSHPIKRDLGYMVIWMALWTSATLGGRRLAQ